MAYKFIFDPVAADEYEEAFEWYEKRSYIASDNFILAVQYAVSTACANPYRYRNTYKDLHEVKVRKYPYQLIYLIDRPKKIITIISLYHNKRNPDKKYIK